jgi:heme exporter protein D
MTLRSRPIPRSDIGGTHTSATSHVEADGSDGERRREDSASSDLGTHHAVAVVAAAAAWKEVLAMEPWIWVVAVVSILAILGLIAWSVWQRRRRAELRESFGAEYERTVERTGSVRDAESELEARRERRNSYDIRPLPTASRDRYVERWRMIEQRFVASPTDAIRDADALAAEVMQERGYPAQGDFEQRVADLSVDHADVVDRYRSARAAARAADEGEANTEDLRRAMIDYRSLIDEMLEDDADVRTRGA